MVHPIAYANEHSPFGNLSPTEFYTLHSVSHSSEFITNSRGIRLFTQWWTPLQPSPPLGVICMAHGFTCESSRAVQLTSVYFAEAGFLVCAIDYEGHGFSDGLKGYIRDVGLVVDDCVEFFDDFRERHAPAGLPSFLYGESLGGAVSVMITLRQGRVWGPRRRFEGMVLMGAMCGINEKFLPPWPLIYLVGPLAAVVPTWPVAITRGSIAELAIKVKWKAKMEFGGPNSYKYCWPRAGSAKALLDTCNELQGRLEEVDVPFLIVQGVEDPICDPAVVEDLYRRASTKDKAIKMYPGMGHLLVGEPYDSVELVFGDILHWLKTAALRFKPTDD